MKKYPKRGEDCEYTEDCMWGVDGWCDRPVSMKCVIAEMDAKNKKEAAIAVGDQLTGRFDNEKTTIGDLTNITGSSIKGYHVERVRVKRGPFIG